MNKKVFGILIAIMIVVLIIILIIIRLIKRDDSGINYNTVFTEEDQLGDVPIIYEKEKLENSTIFYTVEDCINVYFKTVEEKDTSALLCLLDKEYISKNNITSDNVLNYVDKLNNGDTFIATDMYEARNDNIYIYIVEGTKDDGKYTNNVYYIVKFDDNHLTYNITPLYANNYSNIEAIDATNSITSIESNTNNKYTYNRIKDEDILTKYMNFYIKLMQENEKKAYDLLNSEYKDLRFEDFEDFEEYVNQMGQIYNEFNIQGYNIEETSNGKEYIFTNTYNIGYKIIETAPMDFTILLDDYTIETDDFKNKYENANFQTRAITDVDKVMKMINTKDYRALYNVLDETYKANNFATIDSFIEYINTSFFNENYYTISNISEQGPYYLITITCKKTAAASADTKENKIIISIGEGTSFTMSFALE